MGKASDAGSSLKALKYKNRHSVLEYIRANAAVSVAEIAKATNLSKMTVHNIIEHHLQATMIIPAGKGDSTEEGGKKPNLFAFNPDYRYIFSARIVEQELLSAITNLRGEIIASHTALYGRDTSLEEILRLIREAFSSLTKRQKVAPEKCIGAIVGCHGIINVEKGICVISPHFMSWGTNVPLRDRIKEQLPPGIPVYIDNWIRYHAYGEMKANGNGMNRFFLIGTEYDGLAGGLVLDGKLFRGGRGLSGEIGHMVVAPEANVVCVCGGVGCFEAMVSPRRIEAKATETLCAHPDSLLARHHRDVTFANILNASNKGDKLACALVDESVRHFSVAINNLVHSCDPDRIIIQGEYAQAGEYFLRQLRQKVNRLTLLRMDKEVRIEYSLLGDESSLSGAAHFMADSYFDDMDKD